MCGSTSTVLPDANLYPPKVLGRLADADKQGFIHKTTEVLVDSYLLVSATTHEFYLCTQS